MKIQIKHRWSGSIIFEAEAENIRLAVEAAVQKGIDLTGAYLTGAYLTGADLTGADLTGADLTGADLKGTIGFDEIPEIEDLDGKILKILKKEKGNLDMGSWHGPKGFCGTTHCRAGWAVHLAGEFGRALEWSLGSSAAGALLYARAYPDLPIPDFVASNEAALKDIEARAALAKKTK